MMHILDRRRRQRAAAIVLLFSVAITALLALTALPLAADAQQIRIPLTQKSIPAGAHYKSAHAVVAHAAKNFEGPMRHEHETHSFYSDASRTVAMKNFYNRMYTGPVSIGTPATTFSLVFDTGSADLWTFAAKSDKPRLAYVTYYDPSKSSTAKTTTTPWSIQYGKGASSGSLVSDQVSLAGLTTRATFAQASSYSDDFESQDMPLDGILGLAFQDVNSAGVPTLVDNLQAAGLIKERVFSFYFTTDNPEGSEFILGKPDTSLGKTNVTYLDVSSTSGMWILSMQTVTVGVATTDYCAGDNDCTVLLDTGTSFIGMPTANFLDFAARVAQARSDCLIDANSGLIRCERDTTDGLPTLSFSLQGSAFTLHGSDYYQSGVLGFMPLDVGSASRQTFWILGDTFLKTYYTVFDMDNRKIGIAGAKPGAPYTPPGSGGDGGLFHGWSWQLIALIVGLAVGFCCLLMICFQLCCRRSSEDEPSAYVLQQAPPIPVQRSHPSAHHPATHPPPISTQYPGQAQAIGHSMGAHAATSPRQRRTPKPQSEFARDFYGAAAV